jgi:hypothetical protein
MTAPVVAAGIVNGGAMAWHETRASTPTPRNLVAHQDATKERPSELSGLSSRRLLWPAIGVVVLVLLIGGGAAGMALRGSGSNSADEARSAEGPPSSSMSSPSAQVSREPQTLSGSYMAAGRVVGTGRNGVSYRIPLTLRLNCQAACRVTVVDVPADRRQAAIAYTQRSFRPAGNGIYGVAFNELLSKTTQVPPECATLRSVGRATLVRAGENITIRSHSNADTAGSCSFGAFDFVFTGTLSGG